MAITRGQMQRQLRKGGGIMDVASGTIGGGNYAGIPMGSRTGFGILDKVKDRVRKLIPNEISKVATVAAPFVAPFNPALAGAMAGIGSFDQTGSLSDAFKRGALTYGGGQLARGIGGGMQNLQALPGTEGFGGFGGFTKFSSPISSQGGIGKLLEGVKGVGPEGLTGSDVGGNITLAESAGGTSASPTILAEQMSEASLSPRTITKTATESAPKSVIQAIKNKDYFEAAKLAAEKGTKALFTNPITDAQGNVVGSKLDKTMVLAAGTAGLTYLDAKKLADELGEDIGTEEEYDEATKAEKKAEYSSYLTNFFEGKKDGGRIGYANGADYYANMYMKYAQDMINDGNTPMSIEDFVAIIKEAERTKEAQGGRIGYMFGDKVEDNEGIMSMSEDEEDENMKMAYFPGDVFSKDEIRRLFSDKSLTTNQDRKDLYKILMNPGMYPEAEEMLKKMLRGNKDGGRIGFESGANKKFKFMELIEDDTNEKEKLINALLDNAREKFPKASEEDIFNFVMSKAAPMSGLMVDGKFVRSKDIETPSIKLSRDMGGPRYDFLMGGEVPVRKNKAGIEELDYRQTGGFVPVGVKEKADDVPAMLSKNEFVLTADAVRGIGGGDVEKGAEKLYGVMKQAEKVGRA